MNRPIISMIAAIGKNRELGKNNKLLFNIPEDLKRFREITRGHPVIMGRKTAEHLVEFYTKGPLPKRQNIVVTRDPNYSLEGFIVVNSLEDAIKKASEFDQNEIFIIGGAQIYSLGMRLADKLYLTVVDKEVADADAFFPEYTDFKKEVLRYEGEENDLRYAFVDLVR